MSEAEAFDPLLSSNMQNPFDYFARLRDQKPVYWSAQYSFWMLTRYQDVKTALQSPSQYSSATGVAMAQRVDALPKSARDSFEVGKRFFHDHIQASDPPMHTAQRQSVMKAFMPLVTGIVKTSLEQRVHRLLDEIERAGTCDFVKEFAYPLPSSVIFDLLGVPEEHQQTIRETADLYWAFPRAVYRADVEALEQIAEKVKQTEAVLTKLVQIRKREPKADLISALAGADGAVTSISDSDLVVLCVFLLMAGHETTANLLSGSLRYLLQDRPQWERLIAAPDLLPGAVEELLRFVSPVLWVARVAKEDIEIDGHVLRAGSDIRLGIGSANHDPDRFTNPDTLDIIRKNTHSVAFGYGLHACLGAALARMETHVAFSGLLQRMPQISLRTDCFDYQPIYFLRALKSLPVAVRY
jgi:cytochrome P450